MGNNSSVFSWEDDWGKGGNNLSNNPSTNSGDNTGHVDLVNTPISSWSNVSVSSTEGTQIYKWGTTFSAVTINRGDIKIPTSVDRSLVCLNWNGEPDPEAVLQVTSTDPITKKPLTGNCLKCKNTQDTLYLTGDHVGASYGTAGPEVGGDLQGLQFSSEAIPSIMADEDFTYINGVKARSVTAQAANQAKLKGICVGPCDEKHSIHDKINLLRTTSAGLQGGSATSDIYYLYGGTCRDGTTQQFAQPNIPSKYINQVGNPCRQGYISVGAGSSVKCVQEVPLGNIDNGSTFSPGTKSPDTVLPTYSCRGIQIGSSTSLELIDNMCFSPCPPPQVSNGAYCSDPEPITAVPSSIKCTPKPFTYAASSTSGSTTIQKWLCDSQDDLNALIQGIKTSGTTGEASYVGTDDLVCVSTDTTTGKYYCQRQDEAVNGTTATDTLNGDYQDTCNTLSNAYTDISNNLTILSKTLLTAQTAQAKINTIRGILDGVSQSLCPAGTSSTLCTTLSALMPQFDTEVDTENTYVSGSITGPLGTAIQSRDALVQQLVTLQCTGVVLPT